jgi:hypothetical protein
MRMRDSAFSSAAWEKLVYERRTGAGALQVLPSGSVMLQSWKLIWSVPKTCFNTSAAASPAMECSEG